MATRRAKAEWRGNLASGSGTIRAASGAVESAFSAGTRFGEEPGTNPEELVAAAHAGCFSMALSHALSEAGHPPVFVRTEASVHLERGEDGFRIPRIDLDCTAEVPGISEGEFDRIAEQAKRTCPISRLFSSADIRLSWTLEG